MELHEQPHEQPATTPEAPELHTSISIAASTDPGLVRTTNEDTYGWMHTPNGALLVVCDGMGGHSRGRLAAQTALNEISQFVQIDYADDTRQLIHESLLHANQVIATMNHNKIEYRRMGTTAVVALLRGYQLAYAHVGDSRLYLWRQGELVQLTKDHTYVQQLVDGGIITPREARSHPDRNRLTAAVGIDYTLEVTVCDEMLACRPQDLILACTDGLTEVLTDDEINAILTDADGLQQRTDLLIAAARERGGPDNITAALLRINEPL